MISTVQTIRGTAVAHDSVKTLVMLRCKPAEPLPELLARLDLAIATAQFTGKRVDEINRPAVNRTYEN